MTSASDDSVLHHVLNRRIVICAFSGFASGLPYFVLGQLIPGWLRSEGVGLKEIGIFGALVGWPYILKFVWSPLLDRYTLPWLGRRRGWMLAAQVGLLAAIMSIGHLRPNVEIDVVMLVAFIVAFFSATQDIVLDAYRRELLPDVELGLGNAVFVQAYRIAGLVPGTLGLVLSDHLSWSAVFAIIGAFMVVGIGMTLCIGEAIARPNPPRTLLQAVVEPFREFVVRRGWKYAGLALAFMFFYKLGDSMATALSTPFYLDLGFSRTEIGLIAKNAALWPSIIGALLGGVLMLRIGINRALWVFGVVQWVTILGFAVLSEIGNNPWALAIVISLEYLGVGLGTTAFVAFIARETTPTLAATQFALFTALTAVPRTLATATTGFLVEGSSGHAGWFVNLLMALGVPADGLGWTRFFLLCTVLAVPGMVLLFWVAPYSMQESSRPPTVSTE